jgi:ABC-type multidrug transport system permease subunit
MPYYFAKDLIELPISVILPLLFSFFYFGMGTDVTMMQFGCFYLIQLMVTLATSAYGQVIGSLFDTAETACGLAPIVMMPFVLFSGFLTNLDTYPRWIGWIQYFSPIRYGFEAAMRNEFEDYHLLPINIPNPIKFLNFKLGFKECMIGLFLTTILMKVLSCICLKLLMKKFQ